MGSVPEIDVESAVSELSHSTNRKFTNEIHVNPRADRGVCEVVFKNCFLHPGNIEGREWKPDGRKSARFVQFDGFHVHVPSQSGISWRQDVHRWHGDFPLILQEIELCIKFGICDTK